ncbi:MAG: hypothetical protein H0W64_12355 [Gammaproteobacteria bacterium]|nr:hypothetical protein [Gammaproteobacteria bacterium]
MVEFNLLDWREAKYEFEQSEIKKIMLAFILLTLIIWLIAHLVLSLYLNHLNSKSLQYEAEREDNPGLITGERSFLTQLKLHQNDIIDLFEILHHPHQDALCFTSMRREDNKIIFKGVAASLADLTHFLKTWVNLKHFSEVKLQQIQWQESNISFQLCGIEQYPSFQSLFIEKN